MKKTHKTTVVSFSIENDIKQKFIDFCQSNNYNKSSLVNNMIKAYLQSNNTDSITASVNK